ncbi:hypothetical protein MD484_g2715, partial [Candolleomyces efflorescens]
MSSGQQDQRRPPRRGAAERSAALNTNLLASGKSPSKARKQGGVPQGSEPPEAGVATASIPQVPKGKKTRKGQAKKSTVQQEGNGLDAQSSHPIDSELPPTPSPAKTSSPHASPSALQVNVATQGPGPLAGQGPPPAPSLASTQPATVAVEPVAQKDPPPAPPPEELVETLPATLCLRNLLWTGGIAPHCGLITYPRLIHSFRLSHLLLVNPIHHLLLPSTVNISQRILIDNTLHHLVDGTPPLADNSLPLAVNIHAPHLANDIHAPPLTDDIHAPHLANDIHAPPLTDDIHAPPLASNIHAPPLTDDIHAPPLTDDIHALPLLDGCHMKEPEERREPEEGGHKEPPRAAGAGGDDATTATPMGRIPESHLSAARETIEQIDAIIQAASEKYSISQDFLVRSFMKDRGIKIKDETSWNLFQQKVTFERKLAGDTKALSREEVASQFQEFKDQHEDWEDQLEAFKDIHEITKVQNKTYLNQQRHFEKLFNILVHYAKRAHLSHFEVMIAIAGSTIFQNDALNRLYFTPGLVDFSKKRLGIEDLELLGLIMTEACDAVAGPVTAAVHDHIVANRESEVDEGEGPSKLKKGKSKMPGSSTGTGPRKQKVASTTTIVTENTEPPRPEDVVLATGETIDIPIAKDSISNGATYEQKVDWLKPIVKSIVVKANLRTKAKNLPWGRLPRNLAQAGWCLINYPANSKMPGEIPPGVDPETYNGEGIRALKRPELHALIKEMLRSNAPGWKLVKGDPELMRDSRTPVIIQAPPVFTQEEEDYLLATKGKAGGSSKARTLPLERGRRLYKNLSYDTLGPRYTVQEDSDSDDSDPRPVQEQRKPKAAGKPKARTKGKEKAMADGPSIPPQASSSTSVVQDVPPPFFPPPTQAHEVPHTSHQPQSLPPPNPIRASHSPAPPPVSEGQVGLPIIEGGGMAGPTGPLVLPQAPQASILASQPAHHHQRHTSWSATPVMQQGIVGAYGHDNTASLMASGQGPVPSGPGYNYGYHHQGPAQPSYAWHGAQPNPQYVYRGSAPAEYYYQPQPPPHQAHVQTPHPLPTWQVQQLQPAAVPDDASTCIVPQAGTGGNIGLESSRANSDAA